MEDYGHIEFYQMFCLSPMSAFLNKITTKNVKPLPRFYTPGLYPGLFLYPGIMPRAYTVFFIAAVSSRL